MREFTALDWYTISTRGPVAIVDDPGYDSVHDLLYETVIVDGVTYKVTGIEAFQTAAGVVRDKPWGLLVDRADA